MDEHIRNELMIHVERAVRPVRASRLRKRALRLDWFGRANAMFEEQYKALGDPIAALESVKIKLGNPAEIQAQIEATISFGESWIWLIENQIRARPGEGLLKSVCRQAFVAWLAFDLLFLPIMFFSFAVVFLLGANPAPFMVGAAIAVACLTMLAILFLGILLVRATQAGLYGPAGWSWPRSILVIAAAGLSMPMLFFAAALAAPVGAWTNFAHALRELAGPMVITPMSLIFCARLTAKIGGKHADETWARMISLDVVWLVVVSSATFGLEMVATSDVWVSLEYLVAPLVVLAFLFILELILTIRKKNRLFVFFSG